MFYEVVYHVKMGYAGVINFMGYVNVNIFFSTFILSVLACHVFQL